MFAYRHIGVYAYRHIGIWAYRHIGISIPVPYKTPAKMRILNASEPLTRREHISVGTLSVVRYYDAARVDI